MKAVACQDAELELVDRPTPGPGPGQGVLDVLACGSCGGGYAEQVVVEESLMLMLMLPAYRPGSGSSPSR
jgi:hypothetical protein